MDIKKIINTETKVVIRGSMYKINEKINMTKVISTTNFKITDIK